MRIATKKIHTFAVWRWLGRSILIKIVIWGLSNDLDTEYTHQAPQEKVVKYQMKTIKLNTRIYF